MRKAAGFLLVLLLATLVVITTSSGDETDSSHQVHLSGGAPYGPQIASCGDCHPSNYQGVFSDIKGFAFTEVCDPCHSPGGAYDGVNSTSGSVGAKDNWNKTPAASFSSDVYSGADLQPGKEKWCVGCHDDVPAQSKGVVSGGNNECTADQAPYSCCTGPYEGTCDEAACEADPNCVFAPNIAGDDIDYGYYKTGHGKYVSESITCTACHDPDFEHVLDGVARTYKATSDNYQAGYRLKSVGGGAPLEIPRPATVSADHFRLCFSCHDSAPFMDELNYDTNFRADVDANCNDLINPVNRHYSHLSITDDKYDSDFDGVVTPDSPPSCPACHNVHGPRVRTVPPGITNAPGMIRTGELIGREIEGALDLDYFTSTCTTDLPSVTYSTDNETVGSTGGMMFDYGAGDGTIARNGVCDMCHIEAEPYWREAKSLPVQAGNDFSGDGNAKALWSLEETSGDRSDSSGNGNTLTDNATVGYGT
ncbi:hypothetical protein ACFL0B_07995, partial [Thermodesulfobacteriota bacterium]